MVYHGTYAAYLEAARVEMLRDSGWVYAELEKAGTLLPVVQLNLTYKKPARYDQMLEVHTVVAEPPTSKMRLLWYISDLLVTGEVVFVFVDAEEVGLAGRQLGLPNGGTGVDRVSERKGIPGPSPHGCRDVAIQIPWPWCDMLLLTEAIPPTVSFEARQANRGLPSRGDVRGWCLDRHAHWAPKE